MLLSLGNSPFSDDQLAMPSTSYWPRLARISLRKADPPSMLRASHLEPPHLSGSGRSDIPSKSQRLTASREAKTRLRHAEHRDEWYWLRKSTTQRSAAG